MQWDNVAPVCGVHPYKIHKVHVDSNPFFDRVVFPSSRTLRLFYVSYMGLGSSTDPPPHCVPWYQQNWQSQTLLHLLSPTLAKLVISPIRSTEECLLILATMHPLSIPLRQRNPELPDYQLGITWPVTSGSLHSAYINRHTIPQAHSTHFTNWHLITFKRGWTPEEAGNENCCTGLFWLKFKS